MVIPFTSLNSIISSYLPAPIFTSCTKEFLFGPRLYPNTTVISSQVYEFQVCLNLSENVKKRFQFPSFSWVSALQGPVSFLWDLLRFTGTRASCWYPILLWESFFLGFEEVFNPRPNIWYLTNCFTYSNEIMICDSPRVFWKVAAFTFFWTLS